MHFVKIILYIFILSLDKPLLLMADKQAKLCVYIIHLGTASSIDEDHQSWGFSPSHTVIFHASEGSNPIPHIQCGLIMCWGCCDSST